jgi:hypothetical protein
MFQKFGQWLVNQHFLAERLTLFALCVALVCAVAPQSAFAQGIDPGAGVDTIIEWAKMLWGYVFAISALMLVVMLICYLLQGIIPALWQPFAGGFAKMAILWIVGGNVAFGILLGLAEANKGGWTGS